MQIQHIDVLQGEDRTQTLSARDSSNTPVNLTGLTLSFIVGRRPTNPQNNDAVLTYAGTIVSASAGTFTVPIAGADTSALLPGVYQHQTNAVSGAGVTVPVCSGHFTLRQAAST